MAIIRVTKESAERAIRAADWAKIDAITDAEIERAVKADPEAPPILTDAETAAGMARHTRHELGLTQAAFAARFQIPLATLRDWEQERRQPDAAALTYLRVIQANPQVVASILQSRADRAVPQE